METSLGFIFLKFLEQSAEKPEHVLRKFRVLRETHPSLKRAASNVMTQRDSKIFEWERDVFYNQAELTTHTVEQNNLVPTMKSIVA